MKLRQAQISSEQGNINLAALAGNIHVEAGQEKEHITSSTKSTSKGWFSKTNEIRRHEHKFDNALGSSLDGKNISLIAGGNIHLQGTQTKAEQNIELSARGNINIDAVKNRHEQMTWEKYKKSGLHASFKGGTAQIGLGATKSKLNTNSVDETVVGSSLIAKENLTVVSKGDLLINAAQLGANKDMTLQGQNVHINALTEQHQRSLYRYAKSIGMNIGITYSPLLAGLTRGKETLDEQGFKNRSTIGKVMSLADAGYEAFERSYKPVTFSVSASKQSLNQNEKQQLAVASEIVAGQNLNIIANKGDIISQGATLQAEGDLSLVAKEDIQLNTSISRITRDAHSKQQGIQFDTSKSWLKEFGVYSNKQKENEAEIRHQSTSISVGGNSLLFSGKDIKTQGADIAVDGDIQLVAKGNITLGTSHNEQHNQSKSKGIGIGHAKLSDTEHFTGLNLDRSQQKGNNIPHKGTILGSTTGNVSIYTDKNYLQDSSAVIANNGKVNIVTTNNIISRSQDNTSLMTGYSRGTKVGVFAKVSSPLLDALNLVQQGQHLAKEDKSNNRLKALQAGVLAWQGYDTYSAIKSGALLRAEAGIGFSHGQSSYRQSAVESQGNFINGKQGVTLQANQGKIDLSHIQLSSKDALGNIMPDSYIELKAKEGIALSSGRAEYQHNQKQMKAGAQVGLGVQAGAGTGAYVYVEAGYQQGKQQSHSHQKHNSRVETANFKAESGKDIELQGASVYANKINVQADGDLRIISEQSESHSKSQQTGANIRAQASLGTAWGFSGSFNQHKGKENRKQVEEQAGLFAGKGGYRVSADKISLVGGAIVSTAEKAKNQLIAKDFQFKDIQNESDAKASSLALMGGFSINRDQTSAEDKKLNKLYREEKLKKGETFHQANQNTNHQGLKFGLNNQDVHSNDLYAASKLLLANALGNSQTQSSDSTVTKSVVSEGEFHIASETGKQQLAKVSKDSTSSNQKVADYDMDKMLSENKTKTEVNKFLLGKVAAGTDEAYRTMFIAEHRLMTFELDENGNLIKDQDRMKVLEKLAKEKYKKEKPNVSEDKFIKEYIFENPLGINVYKLREVSDQERQALDKVTYFDPKTKTYKSGVAVMFNGILNDQQAAAKYAVQNYIAEKDGTSIYKNIYFVHHPQANNDISELLIASYQKYLEGSIGSLGNSTLQAKNIMEKYGTQGLYIGSHSRGTLTVDNALRELDKYDNRGILSNTKVKMVGPAADVNQANRRFIRLQGNNSKESIRFENNKLDSVGSLIGSNPYTTKTNINNFGIFKRTYDLLFGDTSAHNCYGIGNPQCINDGYRKDKLMNLEVPFTELEKSKDKE
ncbi:hypothetical protein GVX86_09685 [[Haemophilus] felis]|nr:hypothetical protein [[Haemophilus] felis]